ncbi:UbiA-like polyprenyltransferase [Picrophilus oshimae]|uniref:4-hydroxybenzoate polyprenyltransferase n=1 Tax=Picrophilus torridus (strain ATCC 700027 / DSM 9790 / JCM 10055 / NBRC 100828 / KAW 2/3) TaxID=1122961 RepID=A0A8G2FVC1_PICTO|nr:UbiA-like polyprenyltransferase [Picrophilus oshimae]SMD30171.1 4-hydroxybenzoate polyprenyltransferase [Picrophilus oshimae DSM 9789]
MLKKYLDYIKIENMLFDLPFILAGMLIASHYIHYIKFLLILIAGASARTSAMSINRIIGKKYDMINPRKKDWALVSGNIKMKDAILFTLIFIVIFEICTFLLNYLVFYLSFFVVIMFIIDPFLKRYTAIRHIFMGGIIGLGVIGGYLAVKPAFTYNPLIYIISVSVALWVAGFDIIYTIQDIEYDKINGLKTIVNTYGIKNGVYASDLFHISSAVLFFISGIIINSLYYYTALLIIYTIMIKEHLIIRNDINKIMTFFRLNSFIGIVFLIGIALSLR